MHYSVIRLREFQRRPDRRRLGGCRWQLLLRFYDPTSGSLILDGHDVRSLNVAYYRSKIGYVGQVRRACLGVFSYLLVARHFLGGLVPTLSGLNLAWRCLALLRV